MVYSLAYRFVGEMLSTMVMVTIGDSVIANEVLGRTKGHALGMGHVSIGFGLAFYIGSAMFGQISAAMNPAMLMAEAFVGLKTWHDALILMIATYMGAFFGALLVYIIYWPHYSVVPSMPKQPRWTDNYVQPPPSSATRNAIASYDAHGVGARPTAGLRFRKSAVASTGKKLADILEDNNSLHHHSIQVATLLHQRDPMIAEMNGCAPRAPNLNMSNVNTGGNGIEDSTHSHTHLRRRSLSDGDADSVPPDFETYAKQHPMETEQDSKFQNFLSNMQYVCQFDLAPAKITEEAEVEAIASIERAATVSSLGNLGQKELPHEDTELKTAYKGILIADQNAKLSSFCTRPAIYHRCANFICETVGTFMLIWAALSILERPKLLANEDNAKQYDSMISLYIGFLVIPLIMGLGGPTGYAANPARDLGPRFAHFLLPIANKGPSEWYYSWIPIFGPYTGAFFGALAFYSCRKMNNYPEWYTGPDPAAPFGGHWN